MFKSIFLPLIAVAAFIVFVGLLSQGKLNSILGKISPIQVINKTNLKSIKINDVDIKVEVAKSNEERSKGLSNRTSLDENSGMVFVFSKNSKVTFWMKDTKIPLDFVWIKDNKIVKIDKNVQPEIGRDDSKLTRYSAPVGVDYVLEVNGGFCDKKNIKVDQTISGLELL